MIDNEETRKVGGGATAWPDKGIVSIPLSSDEIEVVEALRRLKPYGSMKIAKNQNGAKLTITMEESFGWRCKSSAVWYNKFKYRFRR